MPTYEEFKKQMQSIVYTCMLSGLFCVPGCMLFFYGIFSAINSHVDVSEGAVVVGMIFLVACACLAIHGDKKIRELRLSLYPNEK